MDNQTDVGFVYTHTEGVGGDYDPEVSVYEVLLDILLGVRREFGVEVFGCGPLLGKKLGDVLCLLAGCAVDDGASGLV